MRGPFAFVLPIVAAALLGSVALFAHGSDQPAGRVGVEVAVGRTTYACPVLDGSQVTAGQVRPGRDAKATVLPGGRDEPNLADPSSWRSVSPADPTRAVVVTQRGSGSGAVGFASGSGTAAQGAGKAVTRCPDSVSAGWLLGMAATLQHPSYLQLTNLGSQQAVVDVDLYGPDGQIAAVNAKGLVIDGNSTKVVSIADFAAGETGLAVRLAVQRGAVSVLGLDTGTGDLKGTEWQELSPSDRRLVITGTPAAGKHTLVLANPGTTTANVTVSALTSGKALKVRGLTNITVDPGSTTSVDVPAAVDFSETALLVSASTRVAAVVRATTDEDFAFGQSAPALTGATAVPIGGLAPTVLLSAPAGRASVTVEVFNAQMTSLGTKNFDIAAGASLKLDPAKDVADGGAYAVITPNGGPVYGGATFTADQQISAFPLESAPVSARAPSVQMP